MQILYKKEINVPSGFYCTNCPCLMRDRNMQNEVVYYCRLSGQYKRPNSKGQFIKDEICISNCLEALNRS